MFTIHFGGLFPLFLETSICKHSVSHMEDFSLAFPARLTGCNVKIDTGKTGPKHAMVTLLVTGILLDNFQAVSTYVKNMNSHPKHSTYGVYIYHI